MHMMSMSSPYSDSDLQHDKEGHGEEDQDLSFIDPIAIATMLR